MPDQRKSSHERMMHIRAHLEKKSKTELVGLLLELVQDMDETTRQQFWAYLAPPGIATADLRYPSADDFLAELDRFAGEVADGAYYDEDAANYYSEDSYNEYDEYDPDDHAGLQALRGFFHEADSYFDAGQYAVAAQAYGTLLDLVLDDTDESFGLPDPLTELSQDRHLLVQRYLVTLQASLSQDEFFAQALRFFTWHENNEDVNYFLELVGSDNLPVLQTHLEAWADDHARLNPASPLAGLPFSLRLLLRFAEQAGQGDAVRELWMRFRHIYPACYPPLLADRQAAGEWEAVIVYAQEALNVAPPPYPAYYQSYPWPPPDPLAVRGYLARAYSATGQLEKAFELYRPAFEESPSFDTYHQARQLADAVSPEQGQAYTQVVIDALRGQGVQRRYLLCQVYLSESRFDEAYALVENLSGYGGIEESKLVAKAHLLAALGPQPEDQMGTYLKDLYAKVEQGEKEALRFLRATLPPAHAPERVVAIRRAEDIYRRLMQSHIDNGRKTYATAAYYCALLAEIALYEGRPAGFQQWYESFMQEYKRHRALRAEMELKVNSVVGRRSF